jgi:hypothetical protein
MHKQSLRNFAPVIRQLSPTELNGALSLYEKLMLAAEGDLRVCYAPFEFINQEAHVVIVGITPGSTQMINALKEARRQLDLGASEEEVLKAAKATGAFSGSMRPNLTALLDAIGLQRWLGIRSCEELFGSAARLVQTTSVLRNPVFVRGENYNGSPGITRSPLLREQLENGFARDAAVLRNAVFIPLGDKVTEALHYLVARGLMRADSILDGLPHPSGANGERIAYFLGRKARHELSGKTTPQKIEEARTRLRSRVAALT